MSSSDLWVSSNFSFRDFWDGVNREAGFIGISSTTPIHSVEIDAAIGVFDNLRFAPTQMSPEEEARDVATAVGSLDLASFSGPNNNARAGRQNSLANRANEAADLIAADDTAGAIEVLNSLLSKVDGNPTPPDWMDPSLEKTALADRVQALIDQLSMS